jgi:chromosome segregation ATPase
LLLVFSCWAALVSPATGMAGEKTYLVTETELTRLEENLTKQEAVLLTALELQSEQEKELSELQRNLQAALNELQQSKEEIQSLRTKLHTALNSIESANQLLKEYETEMKSKIKTLNRKNKIKNIWLVALSLLLIGTV